MAFASHLGPWLLGTVKNTTGTTAGTVRNMGATTVAQIKNVTYADAAASTAFVIPAGAVITRAQFITTTTFSSAATITLIINSVTASSAVTVTTGGSYSIATTNSQAVGDELVVGSSDVFVTYTVAGTSLTAGAGTLVVEYIMLASDGSANPASA